MKIVLLRYKVFKLRKLDDQECSGQQLPEQNLEEEERIRLDWRIHMSICSLTQEAGEAPSCS